MKAKVIFYLALLYLFAFPKFTYAYVDPGTGSYLFQIFIAGALSSVFFLKKIFGKIKEFFKKSRRK